MKINFSSSSVLSEAGRQEMTDRVLKMLEEDSVTDYAYVQMGSTLVVAFRNDEEGCINIFETAILRTGNLFYPEVS